MLVGRTSAGGQWKSSGEKNVKRQESDPKGYRIAALELVVGVWLLIKGIPDGATLKQH